MLSAALLLHIISGSVAILAGSFALGLVHTQKWHRLSGKVFGLCLLLVYITATYMSVVKEITFLFYVAQFACFSTLLGIRSIQLHKGKKINWIDYSIAATGILIASGMLLSSIVGDNSLPRMILSAVFGILFLSFTLKTIWLMVNTNRSPLAWFQNHVAGMASGYISMVTAFFVTGLDGLMPWYVAWFGPSIVLSIIISKTARKFISPKAKHSIQ